MLDVDVLVIGSGFAGSLMALALRRSGQRVAMLERDRHPRFAIGESSTPLANLLLEELADRYDLPDIRSLSKWGTWQHAHPEVACGLKRGFTFLFHRPGQPFSDTDTHERQLLVAASPHDAVADTHWYRPDFDHWLVRQAEEAGVVYLDETRIDSLTVEGGRWRVDATRRGQSVRIDAGFLIDASGPRGALFRVLSLGEHPCRWLPATEALYTHFQDVDLWEDVCTPGQTPPYPPDAAALHHVFPGGWIWILRFNNGITSAGAALARPLAQRLGTSATDAAWDRLLDTLPSVRRQFHRARPTRPFVHAPELAFRSAQIAGPGWALLPSAAGVIDPLLSTGFPLTLLGILRLLEALTDHGAGPARDALLRAYARTTSDELDATERLVAALYATMADPPLFKRLTLLYFAAVSFSEAARRLHRHAQAPGFLLHGLHRFGPEFVACTSLGLGSPQGRERAALLARIARLIAPFDIAGLLDRSRLDWYPVLASDLVAGAGKLGAGAEEVYELLARSGFVTVAGGASRHISTTRASGPTTNSA